MLEHRASRLSFIRLTVEELRQPRERGQTLINQYGLQKNGGLLLNKINSIAPKNWWQYGIK
jgi:hypothetical protein